MALVKGDSMDSATEKFQRGLQRLAEAGDNRDDLGQALQACTALWKIIAVNG